MDELLARQRFLGHPVRLPADGDPPTVVLPAVEPPPPRRTPHACPYPTPTTCYPTEYASDRAALERLLAALKDGHVDPTP